MLRSWFTLFWFLQNNTQESKSRNGTICHNNIYLFCAYETQNFFAIDNTDMQDNN